MAKEPKQEVLHAVIDDEEDANRTYRRAVKAFVDAFAEDVNATQMMCLENTEQEHRGVFEFGNVGVPFSLRVEFFGVLGPEELKKYLSQLREEGPTTSLERRKKGHDA